MPRTSARAGYFASRWHGHVNVSKLLIWDMLAIGTALNVATGFSALLLLTKGATYSAVLFHFVLVPYNLFLVLSVWRLPRKSGTALTVSIIWFFLMVMI